MPPTGCVLHVEHRRRPPVQETEEQNVQDVFGGLGQYRPNDAQTAPLAQPSHSHQAHQSGGRGLHLPTALPCFLGGYNEGKVRKTGSELPRVDFPYLIERSGGRGILPLVSRVPEPVLPKLTDSLRKLSPERQNGGEDSCLRRRCRCWRAAVVSVGSTGSVRRQMRRRLTTFAAFGPSEAHLPINESVLWRLDGVQSCCWLRRACW